MFICLEILDFADSYVKLNRHSNKHSYVLISMTQINMFFENSTHMQASFELAGKSLGADVINMKMQASSIKKGETFIDTALTLNVIHPDLLVVRHPQSGAVDLLAQKVNCSILNAGRIDNAGCSDIDKRKIFCENAEGLFGELLTAVE